MKTLYDLKVQTGTASLWRPKELGAYRSSHHTKTLLTLEQQGMVERQNLSEGVRPQCGYRITQKGCESFLTFRQLIDVPLDAILGTTVDKMRAQWAYRMAA